MLLEFMIYTADLTSDHMMVVDLQGVKQKGKGEGKRGPVYLLTDPVVCCEEILRFGGTQGGNLGKQNIFKMKIAARNHLAKVKHMHRFMA